MKSVITVHTQLDKALLTKAVKEILNANTFVKYAYILGIVLIVFSLILFVYVFQVQSYAPMIGIFCGTFLIFFKNLMAYFSVQKLGAENIAYEAITYNFSGKEIDIKGETFTAQLYWENIRKVTETKEFILIFQNSLAANIVPKASFNNIQLEQFRSLMKLIEVIEFDEYDN
ncbi:MAG: YcxB family protein [Bacteroidetes bacterium]|nr:YcxB family protein [Bacteroidota bacterium]